MGCLKIPDNYRNLGEEGKEVYVQEKLQERDRAELCSHQEANLRLVAKMKANTESVARAGNKRCREVYEDEAVSPQGQNDINVIDEDDYEMHDGMRRWPLPRVMRLKVPANSARGTRSITVTAVLVYLDSPYDCANGVERRNYGGPVRACEFHRIESVEPDDGRFTQYIGNMFSSLDVSFQLFAEKRGDCKDDGWMCWHDVLTGAPLLDLAQAGAFINPPHMDAKPLCRDYCASLCYFECNDSCYMNRTAQTVELDGEELMCTHLTKDDVSQRLGLNERHGRSMPIWQQSTKALQLKCTTKFYEAKAASQFLCLLGGNPGFVQPRAKQAFGQQAWLLKNELFRLLEIFGTASDSESSDEPDLDQEQVTHKNPSSVILVTMWECRKDSSDQRMFKVKVGDFPPQCHREQDMLKRFLKEQ